MEPSGKRFLLALDVSGSMCCPILGTSVLTCRTASAAMAMVTARTEANYHMMGFSHKLVPLPVNAGMSLSEVTNAIQKVSALCSVIIIVLTVNMQLQSCMEIS